MLATIDGAVIGLFLLISLGIALFSFRKGKNNKEDYFLGGRKFPGWLAGLSIVATTFAADTPLWVTEVVRKDGISANWVWWNMLIGGMFTTYFFARMWHRAGITTDVELVSIRYSGAGAKLLRPLKAIYFGAFLNAVIIAWVNLAMSKILHVFFDLPEETALLWTFGLLMLTMLFSMLGGLRGVMITDAFQFVLAMGGCIALAYLVLDSADIGGVSGLKEKLTAKGYGDSLRFFPNIGSGDSAQVLGITMASFVTFFGLQWWASWYPGNEPGGGGYVAQRLMATKGERSAQQASLIFQVLHYCIRPWPWILIALASLVLYDLPEKQASEGFVLVMRDYLPDGLRGMLLAAFLAAYMSTMSTQLNWGASYLVNDIIAPNRPTLSQKQLVVAGRWVTLLMALIGLTVTLNMSTLDAAFKFLIGSSAGLGLVLILRWYWWRVNAWAEVVAMLTPILVMGGIHFWRYLAEDNSLLAFPGDFIISTVITTIIWLLVAFIGPKTDSEVLDAFQQRMQPMGAWPGSSQWRALLPRLVMFLLAVLSAYAWLIGIGYWLLELPHAYSILATAVGGTLIWWWAGSRQTEK